jgi:hypothetical protein
VRAPLALPLAALAYVLLHLGFHQQRHQLHTRLPDQLADSLSQPTHHLCHRQHQLHRRIPLDGHFLELLHSPLRINLIWFSHSDSPFLGKENLLQPIKAGAESRYFLRTNGHPRRFDSSCFRVPSSVEPELTAAGDG